ALADWTPRLETILAPLEHLHRVFVLASTSSTQDAAARIGAVPGDVVVAGRQTSGRGRRGRAWADTGDAGVAVTVVLPAAPPPRLAVACAVATAEGVEVVLGRAAGIKWPNDVVIDGRKLGGILIEQSGGVARVGIGLNVLQDDWPEDLAGRAVSLRQLGAGTDRLGTLEALLPAIDGALGRSDGVLAAAWAARDTLTGTISTFRADSRTVSGRVLRVDPYRGLAVGTPGGDVWLDGSEASPSADAARARPR
ncbi:MAG: biotin--[acetyl-CoA-carboxylase] ligase, partial [Planctomycetota bacterium]